MDVRQTLEEARASIRRIKAINARIDFYMDTATRATSSLEAVRVSGTGNRSKVEDNVVRLIDAREMLDRELARCEGVIAQAERLIATLDEPKHSVMAYRYLMGMRWDEIAQVVSYDKRYVYKLHGWALQDLNRKTKVAE
jgi:DNA-directed RNA polymerase specialized sigma subunit